MSEQTRKQIAEVWRGDFDKSALLRNVVWLIVEEALEAEDTDALEREYYQRSESAGDRNGNQFGRLKMAKGIVEYAVLWVTGAAKP